MSDHIDARRVRWRVRRGLLELDAILVPFAEAEYSKLDKSLQKCFQRILEEEDMDLLAWLKGEVEVPRTYADVVAHIRAWYAELI